MEKNNNRHKNAVIGERVVREMTKDDSPNLKVIHKITAILDQEFKFEEDEAVVFLGIAKVGDDKVQGRLAASYIGRPGDIAQAFRVAFRANPRLKEIVLSVIMPDLLADMFLGGNDEETKDPAANN